MRRARRQAEVERLQAELDESGPFLGLAREIQEEVRRLADDPDAGLDVLTDSFERLPREARQRVAEATFHALSAERQWEILVHLFGDDELRAALEHERTVRLADARSAARIHALVEVVHEHGVLDTREVPVHMRLTLGLFRESDVLPAIARGRASTACARRLILYSTGEAGVLQVMEDVFNPAGGLFVTGDYDEQRLARRAIDPAHARARRVRARPPVRAIGPSGGRVDVEVAGSIQRGHLHAGYALVGDAELFTKLKGGTS